MQLNLKVADYQPLSQMMEAVRPGNYRVRIKGSKQIDTRSGAKALMMQLETLAPQAGAQLTQIFNLWHNNPDAVQIALRELADIARSCGMTMLGNTDELNGKELDVTVTARQYREKFQNDICNWRAIGAGAPYSQEDFPPLVAAPVQAGGTPAAGQWNAPPVSGGGWNAPAAGQAPAGFAPAAPMPPAQQPPVGQPPVGQYPPQQQPAAPAAPVGYPQQQQPQHPPAAAAYPDQGGYNPQGQVHNPWG